MKPYQKARIIERVATVAALALLVVGITQSFIDTYGQTGVIVTRVGACVFAPAGIIIGRHFSVCPHCGKKVNVLKKTCSECGKYFDE